MNGSKFAGLYNWFGPLMGNVRIRFNIIPKAFVTISIGPVTAQTRSILCGQHSEYTLIPALVSCDFFVKKSDNIMNEIA